MPIHIFNTELNCQVEGRIQISVLKGGMSSDWMSLCLLCQVMIRIIKILARLRPLNSDIPFIKKKKKSINHRKLKYISFLLLLLVLGFGTKRSELAMYFLRTRGFGIHVSLNILYICNNFTVSGLYIHTISHELFLLIHRDTTVKE